MDLDKICKDITKLWTALCEEAHPVCITPRIGGLLEIVLLTPKDLDIVPGQAEIKKNADKEYPYKMYKEHGQIRFSCLLSKNQITTGTMN